MRHIGVLLFIVALNWPHLLTARNATPPHDEDKVADYLISKVITGVAL